MDDLVVRLRAAGCVFAEDEARILVGAAGSRARLERLAVRRESGEPLEHVVGWAEFMGLRIAVEPGVFVPRRRTEGLVTESLRRLMPGSLVVELCCGSGAVGAALSAQVARLRVHAVDIDAAAVACARQNLPASAHVYLGDLFAPLPTSLRGQIDMVVANAPYVPSGEIRLLPPEARLHEPRAALDGGADGLDVLRRVIGGAGPWLAPGGHALVEASEQQAPVLVEAMVGAGLDAVVSSDARAGATVIIGTLDRAAAP